MNRKLLITERKMLRRIFGPIVDRGDTCKFKTNDKLNIIIRYKCIINYTKPYINLVWPVHRMPNEREVSK